MDLTSSASDHKMAQSDLMCAEVADLIHTHIHTPVLTLSVFQGLIVAFFPL